MLRMKAMWMFMLLLMFMIIAIVNLMLLSVAAEDVAAVA